jgi:hypothetical protein|tara:strand:- start:947 stop:1207 length:261 start_codon:yes stop_codon:yes gene_type:complete
MKIFFYKSLITFVFIFIFYHLTLGVKIKEFESKINNITSTENIEYIRDKLRDEIKNGLKKENYLNDQDAILLREFFNKIKLELKIK